MANYERMEEIKALVKEKEEGIIQEYISLGKLYFNIHKDDEMQMFKDVNDILELQAQIRDLEEELALLQKDAETEVPYTPSTESKPVADLYPEDSKIAKSAFLYKEIFGKENPMLSGEASESEPVIEEVVAEEAVETTEIAVEEALGTTETAEEAVETTEIAVEEALGTSETTEEDVVSESGETVNEEAVSEMEEIPEEVSETDVDTAKVEENLEESKENSFVVNPFLANAPKQEDHKEDNTPVMLDHTETFAPAFGSIGNEEVDDSKTEVLESNIFEDEKTYVLKDNYAGFDAEKSIAPMPEQNNKSAAENTYGQPMNQPGFQNKMGQINQPGQMGQPGFQNNLNQAGGFQSPFQNEIGKTQPLNAYDYQPNAGSAPTADSAIDNERTMILDPVSAENQNDFPKMQPNAGSANTIHCMSCGKDAPVANFCIFCGAKMK